ncbi:MAG TPA: MerR family transcriptional regulator [Bacillota bacterium]|nr:MerR family transcriptional regulator [Bacillota bacterium]
MTKRKSKNRLSGKDKKVLSVEPVEEIKELFSTDSSANGPKGAGQVPAKKKDKLTLQQFETAASSEAAELEISQPESPAPPPPSAIRAISVVRPHHRNRPLNTVEEAAEEMVSAPQDELIWSGKLLIQDLSQNGSSTEPSTQETAQGDSSAVALRLVEADDPGKEPLGLEASMEGHSAQVEKAKVRSAEVRNSEVENAVVENAVVENAEVQNAEAPSPQEEDSFLSIKQVAVIIQVELSTIRYWEREFAEYLGPGIFRNQRKYFSQNQLEVFTKIKELLKTEQYTIDGAKRRLELDRILSSSLGVEHNFKTTVFMMLSAIMQELHAAAQQSRELAEQVARLREEKLQVEEQLQEEQSKGLLDFLKTKLNKRD